MKDKACKNCHLITKNETVCPKCKTHTLSNPKESKFAEYLKIHYPGKYALRVRWSSRR